MNGLFIISIGAAILASLLVITAFIYTGIEYDNFKDAIPNMDCRDLFKAQNKYDYWLDGGEKGDAQEDLFDIWYDRLIEMECVKP